MTQKSRLMWFDVHAMYVCSLPLWRQTLREPPWGGEGPQRIKSYYFMVKPIHPLSDKVFELSG